ncbi:MAG: PH domain-containing protein [Candidatus Micrarchaeota archaeon]
MKKALKSIPACKKWPILPQKIVKKTIAIILSLLSAVAISLLIFSSFIVSIMGATATLGMLLLILGISSIIIYSYEQAYFNRYFYDLQKDYLVIKKGVFTYGETTMPYARIQDVYVDQDPLDQLFGLYDLHLATASGQSSLTAHIDGLNYEGSEAIKKELLKRMSSGKR